MGIAFQRHFNLNITRETKSIAKKILIAIAGDAK